MRVKDKINKELRAMAHWPRFIRCLEELGHAYTNLFVEGIRATLPSKINVQIKDKDVAYWAGHVAAAAPLVAGVFILVQGVGGV